jgi:hypothetical protein
MKVYIFGNRGNMGRRYNAVLKYLGHETHGTDIEDNRKDRFNCNDYDAIIIATPTFTHLDFIDYLMECGKPILCEKPFINDAAHIGSLRHCMKSAEQSKMKISMVSQYDYMVPSFDDPSFEGRYTSYDYFRTGNDGLAWDCINVIWHARSKIILRNESPIWTCRINSAPMFSDRIDHSYIAMIKDWLEGSYQPQYDRIVKCHQKVLDYLDGKFD